MRCAVVGVAVLTLATSQGGEATWFGGLERALPVSLVDSKDNGVRSAWSRTSAEETVWDFGLGTDISVCRYGSEEDWHGFSARFGVASRFEFGSESFDLWAADFRGGGAWGIRRGATVGEVSVFHESSHLGDEVTERGDRQRRDVAVNGLRLAVSHEWTDTIRVYGALVGQPFADPEELRSFGFNIGGEWSGLPPWRRGYVAAECSVWEWRDWDPDFTCQMGLFLASREDGALLSNARAYVEFHTGQVRLGQYFDRTETRWGLGLAIHW